MFQIKPGYKLVCSAVGLWVLLSSQLGNAADIAHEIRQGRLDSSLSLEIGVGLAYAKIPIVGFVTDDPEDPTRSGYGLDLLVDGRAEWKGLFAELYHESINGGTLGYHLWGNNNTELDIVLTGGFGFYDPSIGEFSSLQERDGDLMTGFRATHHFGNSVLQFNLSGDISDTHDGMIATVQSGHFWQVRNWNLHSVLSFRYYSDRVVDYYLGVSDEEARPHLPAYDGSGGTLTSLELGTTLPLNEKWIFKTTARAHYLPDSVFDSPLSDDRIAVEFRTSFIYVL